MSDVRACLLGCRTPDGFPFRAAPGSNVCAVCSDKLRAVLDDVVAGYRQLCDIDELTPGGGPDAVPVRSVAGPRSPAVDALLAHTDPRSTVAPGERLPALATVVAWARFVRAERSLDVDPARMRSTVPAGRATMSREAGTLRFHWDWLMASDQVDEFAAQLKEVRDTLRAVRREFPKVIRIGKCPTIAVAAEQLGIPIDLACGATLRIKIGDMEVKCRNCGAEWTRDRWHELGDPWTDYAYLAAELEVNPNTLRYWCREDSWRTIRVKGRTVVMRADALATYARRRPGNITIDQAG
jgi:hypothetical protein